MKTLRYILLLLMFPSLAIAGSYDPLSAKTLYIAKRQFDFEPSALSGVWRFTPSGMQFDVKSAARCIQNSSSPLTIVEIGNMSLGRRDCILALVEDSAGQKLFVLFNPQGRLSYKTTPYNPDQIEIPTDATNGPGLKTACRSVESAARKTGGEVTYYEGQVYDHQGNIYEGCEVSLAYNSAETSHPFYLQPGDVLVTKGWVSNSDRDSDGNGISYTAIENRNIFCNISLDTIKLRAQLSLILEYFTRTGKKRRWKTRLITISIVHSLYYSLSYYA